MTTPPPSINRFLKSRSLPFAHGAYAFGVGMELLLAALCLLRLFAANSALAAWEHGREEAHRKCHPMEKDVAKRE